MNNKWKLFTTSLFVVGSLTACNTGKDTAMEERGTRHMTAREQQYNLNRTSQGTRSDTRDTGSPARNPWDIGNLGYTVGDSDRGKDGTADGLATRRRVTSQITGDSHNYIENDTRQTRTNQTNRNQENTGMTGTDQMNGATGTRDYNINRYSTPDAGTLGYNYFYDANRVTNREEKTDHFGNVKYSKINQRIKQSRNRATNDVGYNYYGSRNYHGHLMDDSYSTRNVTINDYNVDGSGAIAEKIQTRVKNLRDVDRVVAVAFGDDVLVAIKPRNAAATGTLESDVRRAAEPYAKGRNVHVTVTKTMYDRVRHMNNRLKNGAMTNDMNRDMTNLFRSIRADYNHNTID